MKKKSTKNTDKGSAKGRSVPIEVTESADYRPVYASGVFGGIDPHDGRLIFFLDRIKPGVKKNPHGAMELKKVNRELQVEIHMSPSQFASVAKWMAGHVQGFEKRIKTKKKASPEPSGTSYIG